MESTRGMTRERGSPAESKNCEILLLLTADRRLDTKVKCPTGWASFWVKLPTVRSLTRVKRPGIARGGGGMGGFGIDWYINRTFDYTNRSVIERSIGFDYQSFGNRTFDCVRLAKFYCEFAYVRSSSAIERLVFDWVRLPHCSIG